MSREREMGLENSWRIVCPTFMIPLFSDFSSLPPDLRSVTRGFSNISLIPPGKKADEDPTKTPVSDIAANGAKERRITKNHTQQSPPNSHSKKKKRKDEFSTNDNFKIMHLFIKLIQNSEGRCLCNGKYRCGYIYRKETHENPLVTELVELSRTHLKI